MQAPTILPRVQGRSDLGVHCDTNSRAAMADGARSPGLYHGITEDNLCGCMHYTATDVQFGREWDRLRSDVNAVAAACATLTANRRSDGLKNVRALRKSTWPNGMAYRLQSCTRYCLSTLAREVYATYPPVRLHVPTVRTDRAEIPVSPRSKPACFVL